MIRTLIIDDEIHSRLTLQQLLEDYCPKVEVLGMATDVASGVAAIQQVQPDLVFLDIAMPDGEGFEVLERSTYHKFKTIFVTAYNNHAVKAFEYAAMHYLLKPINIKHLRAAVDRVQEAQSFDEPNQEASAFSSDSIVFQSLHHKEVFAISEISYFESNGKYAFLYQRDGRKVFINTSLAELEQQFAQQAFFRIHRSYLIQLNAIHKVRRVGKECAVIMDNGSELSVATRKIAAFLSELNAISQIC